MNFSLLAILGHAEDDEGLHADADALAVDGRRLPQELCGKSFYTVLASPTFLT